MLLLSLRPITARPRLLIFLLATLLTILVPHAAPVRAEEPPAAGAPAALVEKVQLGQNGVTLATDGQIEKYRYFALSSPPRLVVDIYDVEPSFAEREFLLQGVFRRMRVGIYADKTRFVFDASQTVPEHTVISTGQALEVMWNEAGQNPEPQVIDHAARKDPFVAPPQSTAERRPAASGAATAQPASPTGVSLDFTDIELADLIKTISELTGRNFVYDDTVKGKVTVITPERISRDEAYQLFLTVLSVKGFTVIPSGKVHKIIRDKDAKETNLPLLADGRLPSGEQFVTRLVRLQHIDAETMADRVLAPLVPKTGNIVSYTPANTLIITDSAANIERLVKIIRRLDVPSSVDQLEVIALEFANAEEVAEICSTVLSQTGPQAGGAKNGKPGEQGATSQVLPYPRTNSLLVMASAEDLKTVRDLVARLDKKPSQDRARINVYYLENADAEKLAETLNEIVSGKKGVVRTGRSNQTSSMALSEDLSITADKPTNALIINGSPEDYEQVREIIARLDIKRKQVYVETLILELSMDATRQLGASLQGAFEVGDGVVSISTNPGAGPASLSNFLPAEDSDSSLPTLLSKTIDGILLGGLFNPITVEGADGQLITVPAFSALIDLSKTDSDINILSAPRLLTSDNEEAEIVVGANVPIITERLTDTGSSDGLAQSVSVERKDVALTLRFTPQITEGDLVRLNVYQEITNIAQTQVGDVDQVGPTLTKRLLRNTVLAEDGQTVVLGGLIDSNVQESVTKVPLLGDIPVLGWLFKHTSKIETKTNLLVFITPRIIRDKDDLAAVTRRSSRAMEAFRPEGAPPLIPAELLGDDLLYAPFEASEPPAAAR